MRIQGILFSRDGVVVRECPVLRGVLSVDNLLVLVIDPKKRLFLGADRALVDALAISRPELVRHLVQKVVLGLLDSYQILDV